MSSETVEQLRRVARDLDQMQYAALWGDVKVLMLDKDLKDMTEEELREVLDA